MEATFTGHDSRLGRKHWEYSRAVTSSGPGVSAASLFSRACRNLASGGGRVLRFGLERPGGFLSVHTTTLPQAAAGFPDWTLSIANAR